MAESESIKFFKDFIETLKINGEEQVLKNNYCKSANMAIKAFEKMEKIKEIIDNANQWSKEDVVVKAQAFCDIEKIVRSDSD